MHEFHDCTRDCQAQCFGLVKLAGLELDALHLAPVHRLEHGGTSYLLASMQTVKNVSSPPCFPALRNERRLNACDDFAIFTIERLALQAR